MFKCLMFNFTLPLIAPLTGLSHKHCLAEDGKLKLELELEVQISFQMLWRESQNEEIRAKEMNLPTVAAESVIPVT